MHSHSIEVLDSKSTDKINSSRLPHNRLNTLLLECQALETVSEELVTLLKQAKHDPYTTVPKEICLKKISALTVKITDFKNINSAADFIIPAQLDNMLAILNDLRAFNSEYILKLVQPIRDDIWNIKNSIENAIDVLLQRRPESIKTYESTASANDLPSDISNIILSKFSSSPSEISVLRRVSTLWKSKIDEKYKHFSEFFGPMGTNEHLWGPNYVNRTILKIEDFTHPAVMMNKYKELRKFRLRYRCTSHNLPDAKHLGQYQLALLSDDVKVLKKLSIAPDRKTFEDACKMSAINIVRHCLNSQSDDLNEENNESHESWSPPWIDIMYNNDEAILNLLLPFSNEVFPRKITPPTSPYSDFAMGRLGEITNSSLVKKFLDAFNITPTAHLIQGATQRHYRTPLSAKRAQENIIRIEDYLNTYHLKLSHDLLASDNFIENGDHTVLTWLYRHDPALFAANKAIIADAYDNLRNNVNLKLYQPNALADDLKFLEDLMAMIAKPSLRR